MPKSKKRTMSFYSEMIIVTILSLLAANLWIEYAKRMIVLHFNDHPSAIIALALLVSLLAVCFLNMLFAEQPTEENKKN